MLFKTIRKRMKFFLGATAVLFVISIFALWGADMSFGPRERYGADLPRDVAVINGEAVSRDDFTPYAEMYKRSYAGQYPPYYIKPTMEVAVLSQALNDLFMRKIYLQQVQALNLRIDRADLNKRVNEFQQRVLGDEPEPDPSVTGRLRGLVESVNRNRRYKDILTQQMGTTPREIRRELEEQVYIETLNARVREDLVRKEKESVMETMEGIKAQLAEGEPFENLASIYSEDPSAADNDGDLGWFGRGRMVAEFEAAAFTLEPGRLSDPVESPFGFHLIRVHDVRYPTPEEIEERRFELEEAVRNRLGGGEVDFPVTDHDLREQAMEIHASHILLRIRDKDALFSEWIEDRFREAEIEILDPYLKAYRYANQVDATLQLAADLNEPAPLDHRRALQLWNEAANRSPTLPGIRPAAVQYGRAQVYKDWHYHELDKQAERDALEAERDAPDTPEWAPPDQPVADDATPDIAIDAPPDQPLAIDATPDIAMDATPATADQTPEPAPEVQRYDNRYRWKAVAILDWLVAESELFRSPNGDYCLELAQLLDEAEPALATRYLPLGGDMKLKTPYYWDPGRTDPELPEPDTNLVVQYAALASTYAANDSYLRFQIHSLLDKLGQDELAEREEMKLADSLIHQALKQYSAEEYDQGIQTLQQASFYAGDSIETHRRLKKLFEDFGSPHNATAQEQKIEDILERRLQEEFEAETLDIEPIIIEPEADADANE